MMCAEPLVWITRAEPGAAVTAERVRALGFAPLVEPLLSVHPLDAPLDLTDVGALAFTSTNGVAVFAERSPRRDFEVFAVGDATASAARAVGFERVASADGDGLALARLIAEVWRGRSGWVLAPGPANPAVDLAKSLERAGIPVRAVALYETRPSAALPAQARIALEGKTLAAVLVHSARAAKVLAQQASGCDFSSVQAIGLSSACLEPLSCVPMQGRTVAGAPREDALLSALVAALGPALGKRTPAR